MANRPHARSAGRVFGASASLPACDRPASPGYAGGCTGLCGGLFRTSQPSDFARRKVGTPAAGCNDERNPSATHNDMMALKPLIIRYECQIGHLVIKAIRGELHSQSSNLRPRKWRARIAGNAESDSATIWVAHLGCR